MKNELELLRRYEAKRGKSGATYLEPLLFTFSSTLGRFSTDGTESTLVVGATLDEARIVQVERVSSFVPSRVGRGIHEVQVGEGTRRVRRRDWRRLKNRRRGHVVRARGVNRERVRRTRVARSAVVRMDVSVDVRVGVRMGVRFVMNDEGSVDVDRNVRQGV